jgi:hypothetical protein
LSYSDAKNDGGHLIPATTPSVPSNKQYASSDLVPQFGTYILNTPLLGRLGAPYRDRTLGTTQQTIASVDAAYKIGDATGEVDHRLREDQRLLQQRLQRQR